MSIIVFSGELDKAMAAFNLALGGASMGKEVTMFFTFWGLNVLKKDKGGIKSKGWMRKMLNAMNRGGPSRLPLSRFHMLGMGTGMMKKLMGEVKFPSVQEQIAIAKSMGVKFVVCTTSMGIMGISKDAFIPGIDDYAGVATYLEIAGRSGINLFI